MKIGIIKYINSIPFGHGLSADADVVFDHPAALAERFAAGELDASFIPTLAWLDMQDRVSLVPGLSISSFGETRSVLVISQVPADQIRTLALFPESRTSNTLAQIILRKRHGAIVQAVPPGTPADARVVIGDAALAADRSGIVLDLGQEWLELTGLPLVYAVCVARTPALATQAAVLLQAHRDRNLLDLERILAERGLPQYLGYLRNTLDYHLQPPHRQALQKMASFVQELQAGTRVKTAPDHQDRHLLVTGATGLVGGYLLSRLAGTPGLKLAALVRAPNQAAAQQRLIKLGAWFGMPEAFASIEAIPGDLMQPDLGLPPGQLQELRSRITDVFHAAASTAFEDDDAQTTSRTNIQSTEAILAFIPPAARLFHVSTAYIAGDIQGDFLETDLDRGQRFRNDYERSKAEAEARVQAAFACTPGRLTILRPSIVTGERGTGRTFQFSSFYAFLRVLHKLGKRHPGTEVSIPHLPAATQNYIPVDQLADQMAEIVLDPRHWGRTYHLVNATPPTSREMQALLETDLNIRIVNRDPAASPHTHDRMLGRHVARYLPYLQGEARFDMANARQLAATANPTPFDADYLRQLLDYAIAAHWGRE